MRWLVAAGLVVVAGVGACGLGGLALGVGADAWAAAELDRALAEADLADTVTHGAVDARLLSGEVAVADLAVVDPGTRREQVHVDELVCGDFEERDGLPTSLSCAMRGLRLTPEGWAGLVGVAPPARELDLGGSVSWKLGPDGHLDHAVEVSWRGLGAVGWTVALEGLDVDGLRRLGDALSVDPRADGGAALRALAEAAPGLALREVSVHLRDLGARGELYRAIAEEAGTDPANVGPALAQLLDGALLFTGAPPGGSTTAVQGFLEQGGRLRLGTHVSGDALPLFARTAEGTVLAPAAGVLDAAAFTRRLGLGVDHLP